MNNMKDETKKRLEKVITSINMNHSSRMPWKTIINPNLIYHFMSNMRTKLLTNCSSTAETDVYQPKWPVLPPTTEDE